MRLSVMILMYILSGKNVASRAQELLSLPSIRELDLPSETGKPAQRLMAKLGLDEEKRSVE